MAFRNNVLGFIVSLLVITGIGCIGSSPPPEEGFAIYLPAGGMSPDESAIASHIELEEQPLLSTEDIVGYDDRTHTIELTPAAYARLDPRELPGKPFVVCLGQEPIYTGTFVSPVFSRSFEGPVVEIPSSSGTNTIRIQIGYPEHLNTAPDGDPRSDPRLMRTLESAGKLRE